MSVGVAVLDADHERIIELLNATVTALDEGRPGVVVDELFIRLIAVVEHHFAREESAMQRCQYDGLAYHAAEHRKIGVRLHEIRAEQRHDADRCVPAEVRDFLTNWLYGHVLVDDFAYRTSFREQLDLVNEAVADR